MGIISGTVKTIVTGVAVRKAVELAGNGFSKLSEKIEKNRPKDVEENAELLGTEYNLRVLETDQKTISEKHSYSISSEYSVFDQDGYEVYKIKNEKAKCNISSCLEPERRLTVIYRNTKKGKQYTMIDGTSFSDVLLDGFATKKLIKDSTGAAKKYTVNVYEYKEKGWVLEEIVHPHKATLAYTKKSEPVVTIIFSGSDFVIGYNDKELEVPALMAACLTIVEESKENEE